MACDSTANAVLSKWYLGMYMEPLTPNSCGACLLVGEVVLLRLMNLPLEVVLYYHTSSITCKASPPTKKTQVQTWACAPSILARKPDTRVYHMVLIRS